jgi:hypothetical protein
MILVTFPSLIQVQQNKEIMILANLMISLVSIILEILIKIKLSTITILIIILNSRVFSNKTIHLTRILLVPNNFTINKHKTNNSKINRKNKSQKLIC